MQADSSWSQIEPSISSYETSPAACLDYDPRGPHVAAHVAAIITLHLPNVIVEHVGSTAVPGCAGKGVIDLMLLYGDGRLEEAKSLLEALGFQPQVSRDPFPESRPMRVGEIEFEGSMFRLHVHVIEMHSPEVAELRAFRDALCADPEMVADYVARKRQIIASGVTDSVDYSIEKGNFIQSRLVDSVNS
ncbi:MAG: GrpB family protein [Blastocatellia bacterium]